ncbi:peptidoglycan-binding protein [Clostridium sp. LY3-2]|uniref:peptidoglycan-binding domain-containing protein n=1 Tax=Clostridium sp. LY3-2 TaxID=2942482 RepID=UPI002152B193|nr:peptidoglycan-binding protein [Clostridium sp. LY3-2]MCR6514922.1 peptidoglycan-binding protein [Clostridium sp. LY3-2]
MEEDAGLIHDGIFGYNTYITTKRFQRKYNLNDDGIVGNATWNKLCERVRYWQRILKNAGFYHSSIDGLAGDGTWDAWCKYRCP